MEQEDLTHLPLKEIARRVREELKAEFPNCKFAVQTEYYSMGQALHVNLIKADRKVIRDIGDVSDTAVARFPHYTRDDIARKQAMLFHQLSPSGDEYDPNRWNNGVFLTEEGHGILKRAYGIINKYNYDHSDPQSDYYDVHFHLDMMLGQYPDKPFVDGVNNTTKDKPYFIKEPYGLSFDLTPTGKFKLPSSNPKGWHREPINHALASKGIKVGKGRTKR